MKPIKTLPAGNDANANGRDAQNGKDDADDWGMADGKRKFSRGMQIGVTLMALVVAAFGGIVYLKYFNQDAEEVARTVSPTNDESTDTAQTDAQQKQAGDWNLDPFGASASTDSNAKKSPPIAQTSAETTTVTIHAAEIPEKTLPEIGFGQSEPDVTPPAAKEPPQQDEIAFRDFPPPKQEKQKADTKSAPPEFQMLFDPPQQPKHNKPATVQTAAKKQKKTDEAGADPFGATAKTKSAVKSLPDLEFAEQKPKSNPQKTPAKSIDEFEDPFGVPPQTKPKEKVAAKKKPAKEAADTADKKSPPSQSSSEFEFTTPTFTTKPRVTLPATDAQNNKPTLPADKSKPEPEPKFAVDLGGSSAGTNSPFGTEPLPTTKANNTGKAERPNEFSFDPPATTHNEFTMPKQSHQPILPNQADSVTVVKPPVEKKSNDFANEFNPRSVPVDRSNEFSTFDGKSSFNKNPASSPPAFDAANSPRKITGTSPKQSLPPTKPIAQERLGGWQIDSQPAQETSYVVQENDNFWSISRQQYGSGRYFNALARYNAQTVSDPKKLRPGMKILTPRAEVLERRYPDLFPAKKAPQPAGRETPLAGGTKQPGTDAEKSELFVDTKGQPLVKVGSQDTLSSIAQRHLGRSSRWKQIYELNRDVLKDADTLKIGTILRLPADASQVRLMAEPPDIR